MTSTHGQAAEPILLAFSGGLDTSFCVPWLKDTYQRPVITVTVDTGGIDAAAAKSLAERSALLGALEHHLVDAGAAYFDQVLQILDHGQRQPRQCLSPLRRRGAGAAGADHRANGAVAQNQDGRAWLHRRRQRSGALRSRSAHPGAGSGHHRAGARPRFQTA